MEQLTRRVLFEKKIEYILEKKYLKVITQTNCKFKYDTMEEFLLSLSITEAQFVEENNSQYIFI